MTGSNAPRALVLSGGGGRGAYHIGVLRFLEEHEWTPDIVVGTSIGAVNGAALASGHTAHSLWALWRRLKTDDVQRQSWDLFSLDGWDHLLDTAPLRETLIEQGWIDLDRINAQPVIKHLRLTVVEMETGRLRVVGNSPDAISNDRCEQTLITLDHILASCSIPLVYPPTKIDDVAFWDGGTVANTPLGPAIDAGAEDIIVVLMTPWENERNRSRYMPVGGVQGLLAAAQAAFEWALLASFQADMKLFHRTNRIVQLTVENARLKKENAALQAQLKQPSSFQAGDVDLAFQEIAPPIIVSPRHPIPVADIIRYNLDTHEHLYQMGYEDARAAWGGAGRLVEGGVR